MDTLSAVMIQPHAIACAKNIIIFLKTAKEHLKHTSKVLLFPKSAEMTIELENCSFWIKNLVYFGQMIA